MSDSSRVARTFCAAAHTSSARDGVGERDPGQHLAGPLVAASDGGGSLNRLGWHTQPAAFGATTVPPREPTSGNEQRPPVPRALRELRSFLRKTTDLLHLLSPEELNEHGGRLLNDLRPLLEKHLTQGLPADMAAKIQQSLKAGLNDRDVRGVIDTAFREVNEHAVANYKRSNGRRPTCRDRDREIVRLRDFERRTFKEIGTKLKELNPKWVGPDGKTLKAEAVRHAYNRAKARLSSAKE
jgi:hypothetical protein